jgi:PEP-CTERM motif
MDFVRTFRRKESGVRAMNKFTNMVAATLVVTVATPASATYFVNFGSVLAEGTSTTSAISYSCTSNCPTTVSAYTTFVNGLYGGMALENLDGSYSFTGQDRARGFFTASFVFVNGSLLSSSLSGFDELTRCFSIPCTASNANYAANNFALQVRDERTGLTSLMAPVPEPETWGLLLMGFGSIGYVLRQRRRTAGAALLTYGLTSAQT